MVRIKALLPAFLLLLASRPAEAGLCGTVLDPMSVSATALAFGNYLAASASASTNTVAVSCGLLGLDLLPNFTVALSAGNSTNMITRKMLFGAHGLNYNIYTTLGGATVWGDGSGGSVTQSFSSLLQLGSASFTGYGRLPAGQFVTAGGYSDILIVTVTF